MVYLNFFLIILMIKELKLDYINYLKFPFNTKVKSISKEKLNYIYNEENFIDDFLYNNISINISLGVPKQFINIPLNQYEICFTFDRNNEIVKHNSKYDNNSFYTPIIPYNKNISLSAKKTNNFDINELNNSFDLVESFYLYEYSEKTDIRNSTSYLKFLYDNNINGEDIVFGKIGLDMNIYKDKDVSCPRFIYSLKSSKIIDKYLWYFDFYSSSYGVFYIGPEPHLNNKTLNIYNDYQYVKLNIIPLKDGYVQWNLLFDKASINNTTNKNSIKLNDKMANIDFNLGLIIGTSEYQQYIEQNFFNLLINKNICKKVLVEYIYNVQKNNYYTYNCNPSFNHYFSVSYYDSFPELEFFHSNLEKGLKLYRYDLFERVNGQYYFLIIFEAERKNYIWKLGQPFLKRHQFVFDFDSKALGYYDRSIRLTPYKNNEGINDFNEINDVNNVNNVNNINNTKNRNEIKNEKNLNDSENIKIIKDILTIFVIIIIIIGAFYLGTKIKESRKKRANELKDDDFEYLSQSNDVNVNKKNEQNIEMNKIGI